MQRCHIHLITYLVRDYDEAMSWFTSVLGFDLLEDSDQGDGKRWVVVGPKPEAGVRLLLARAATPEQAAQIGKAAGGRVAYFLYTDDFFAQAERMRSHGVEFSEAPRIEPYGTVAVFKDLYGKKWDLIEPRA